jgi:hypothetical protein
MNESVDDIDLEQTRIAAYSDTTNILYTQYTFNFEFSQQVPPEGEKKIKPACIGRIVMSPGFAKIFTKQCNEAIQNYEKTFGEIKISV